MEVFKEYLTGIDHPDHRERTEEVLTWITNTFPTLEGHIKWNTPMFSDHGTYIIGLSTAKHHMSISPERVGMEKFAEEIKEAGFSSTKDLFRIKWNEPVNYELLEKMIQFNIEDKAGYTKFWRE
ncbi:iron chaperone [Sutcliffiella cohnii]|uniref:Iron chaperone n=1 Tax=Sutcliffiella cohnii TaxID=33932 RepID=A0A223KP61_9BACI|nr:iron chaperone [Sutcliffiella cohnii]AST91113.1 iron chaperone [Sutcliffiella cohnii]